MSHSHRAAIVARPIARLSHLLPASSARRPPSGARRRSVGRSFGRAGEVAVDRPRAKGAVVDPPAAKCKKAIFGRVGMSAMKRRLAVSVGGLWLCSGRLD